MNTKDDGGPAFPRPMYESEQYSDVGEEGMSLRDYFAGQALAGITASLAGPREGNRRKDYAVAAYRYADAMIAERARASE